MLSSRHHVQSGFALVEALIALMVIGITVVSLFAGLSKMNERAAVNRLYTCATAVVQSRIDRSLVDKPFDPGESQVHPDLVAHTETTPYIAVYKDPDTNQVLVSGTMTTTVSSTTVPVTSGSSLGNVTLQKTDVSLGYQFRGRNYNVQLTCLRSPDKAQ
ncbi:MAG: type II secretion system protein [Verrucomicrobiota bacterium]